MYVRVCVRVSSIITLVLACAPCAHVALCASSQHQVQQQDKVREQSGRAAATHPGGLHPDPRVHH